MLLTLFIIFVVCFILIKLLPHNVPEGTTPLQQALIDEKMEALGYNKHILEQLWIYLVNIFTKWDWGISWHVQRLENPVDILSSRLLPTIMINLYSLFLSIPIGLAIGIYAALKKDKWQDMTISIFIMVFISLPSFINAFLLQYFFAFKLPWFDFLMVGIQSVKGLRIPANQLIDAYIIGDFFKPIMLRSIMLPIFALSFGSIAGLARGIRAELTEALTSDYMLLARTKGLTKRQATVKHALKNSMVPILPGIIGMFVGIIGGSIIIEKMFGIPGVGELFIIAINLRDYDVFMYTMFFYTIIGLISGILIDLSYGFLDPRIRMGER